MNSDAPRTCFGILRRRRCFHFRWLLDKCLLWALWKLLIWKIIFVLICLPASKVYYSHYQNCTALPCSLRLCRCCDVSNVQTLLVASVETLLSDARLHPCLGSVRRGGTWGGQGARVWLEILWCFMSSDFVPLCVAQCCVPLCCIALCCPQCVESHYPETIESWLQCSRR